MTGFKTSVMLITKIRRKQEYDVESRVISNLC